MNARIVAFVASRLFAVYLFVMYVLNFTLQGVAFFVSRQTEPDLQGWTYFGISFTPIFSALIAAVLWFGAGWISSRVARSLPEPTAEKMGVDQWKALVVAAIGALFVLQGAGVLNQALKMLSGPDMLRNDKLLPFIAGSGVIYILAGIALIAWSHSIVSRVKALWSWFGKPAFHEEDQ
jgi:hypothetical protein